MMNDSAARFKKINARGERVTQRTGVKLGKRQLVKVKLSVDESRLILATRT
jgi:hypothetical protein